jgi:outer membrane protein assembly factor BamD (BamD/ComL family)
VNLFDRTRPAFDTNGRAIETVEVIQQYDPFGPLTDDAVMMAAGHNFVNEDYVRSAGYYEQLVTDQPQSEHAGKAKILCEQSYLRAYRGPQYDSQDLEGARRMAQIALDSRENYSPDQQQRLEADLRAIHIERAKRDFTTGEDFRMRRYFTSAKYYYGLVVKNFPDTDWARRAEDRLRELGDKETVHFEVTKWFKNPFSRAAAPISNVFSDADSGSMPDSAVSESPQPAGQESSKPAEASPSEKKSLFNLRNWFDQL